MLNIDLKDLVTNKKLILKLDFDFRIIVYFYLLGFIFLVNYWGKVEKDFGNFLFIFIFEVGKCYCFRGI